MHQNLLATWLHHSGMCPMQVRMLVFGTFLTLAAKPMYALLSRCAHNFCISRKKATNDIMLCTAHWNGAHLPPPLQCVRRVWADSLHVLVLCGKDAGQTVEGELSSVGQQRVEHSFATWVRGRRSACQRDAYADQLHLPHLCCYCPGHS